MRKRSSVIAPEAAAVRVYAGYDLSLTGTGYAFVCGEHTVASGTMKPPKDCTGLDRLAWIRDQVLAGLHLYAPAMVLVEDYAFAQANRAHQLGELGGVVRMALAESAYKAAICPIGKNKKFTCGKGNAKKEMLLKDVYKKWRFEAADNNEADAYALARLCQAVANQQLDADGLVMLRIGAPA